MSDRKRRDPEDDRRGPSRTSKFSDAPNAAEKKRRVSKWDTDKSGNAAKPLPIANLQVASAAAEAALARVPTAAERGGKVTASEAQEKAKRAADIQKQIALQLAQFAQALPAGNAMRATLPQAIVLDNAAAKSVNTRDIMSIKVEPIATLKANQRKVTAIIEKQTKEEKKRVAPEPVKVAQMDTNPDTNPYWDPRVRAMEPGTRKKRNFRFVEDGRYIMKGDEMRAKAALYEYMASQGKSTKEVGLQGFSVFDSATNPNLAALGRRPEHALIKRELEPVPDVEWWDQTVLPNGTYTDISYDTAGQPVIDLKKEKVTNLVEHPIPLEPPNEKTPAAMPMFLTKKERKKLRRRNRMERELQKQELVRRGLAPAPEAKVKISNLMKVLGAEATQDPTKIERHVRKQMAARQKAHDDRNQARKLTAEERRAKKMKKVQQDIKAEIQVNLFKVQDLSEKATRFKIDKNANYLHLKGCVILNEDFNLVIAEGGAKALKKFRKLMLRRIKWTKPSTAESGGESEDSDEDDTAQSAACQLVWQVG